METQPKLKNDIKINLVTKLVGFTILSPLQLDYEWSVRKKRKTNYRTEIELLYLLAPCLPISEQNNAPHHHSRHSCKIYAGTETFTS